MHDFYFSATAALNLPWNAVCSIQQVHLSRFPSILHALQAIWKVFEMCWHILSYEVILPKSRLFPNCSPLVFWVTSIACHEIKSHVIQSQPEPHGFLLPSKGEKNYWQKLFLTDLFWNICCSSNNWSKSFILWGPTQGWKDYWLDFW